jgi:hypothetical protein
VESLIVYMIDVMFDFQANKATSLSLGHGIAVRSVAWRVSQYESMRGLG